MADRIRELEKRITEIENALKKLQRGETKPVVCSFLEKSWPEGGSVMFCIYLRTIKAGVEAQGIYLKAKEVLSADLRNLANVCSILANEKRMTILRHLMEGPKQASELAKITKLNSGPLHFHLKELMKTKFIIQESERGPYVLTLLGFVVYSMAALLTSEVMKGKDSSLYEPFTPLELE